MRTRDLKPGFFRNAELTELPHLTRLLYAGLWCFVDRRGRCLDNAKLIKADVFPYENVPVERHLSLLHEHEFIDRYEADGKHCIWVRAFLKHQHPHPHETESVLPASPLDVTAVSLQGVARSQPMDQGDPASLLATSLLATEPSRDLATSHQPPATEVMAGRPVVFRLYEQLFGKGVTPLIAERLQEYEHSHTEDCIKHCFVEAAEQNARSIRLVYSILDRHQQEGCYADRQHHANGTSASGRAPAADSDRDGILPVRHVNLD